jgi:hypothetical protein
MHGPIRYESTQEPADDEERELMNPEAWDWDNAEVLPGGGRVLYEVSPLFSSEEYQALAALAEQQGTDPTEAARRIILDRLAAEPRPGDVAQMGRRRSA